MRRPVARSLAVAACIGAACAPSTGRMQRALDPSTERVIRTDTYLRNVAVISGTASRVMRGDGFVYLTDVAPQLQYLAEMRDTTRFRSLRTFVQEKLIQRDATGMTPGRRFRPDQPLEKASADGVHRLGEALADGWRLLGDTASAQLLAQVNWSYEEMAPSLTPSDRFTIRCADAIDAARLDRAQGRAMLASAEREFKALDVRGKIEELDVLSCLTRLAVAVQDPDATVKHLDRMLDILDPFVKHSGRPNAGTSADVLMTLRQVRVAGPKYFDGRE